MSKHNAACCGCGWTGRMEHATDHISGCLKYAQRWQDDPHDEYLDPGDEWARRQREDEEPAAEVAVPDREAVARNRAEQIRKAGVFFVDKYAQAVIEEDWKAMGYDSVADWREGEFGMFRMLPEVRAEAAHLMLEGGQPVPAIAAATGVTERTVERDLAADIPSSLSPAATVSDNPQASEPPKVTAKPADVTNVTPPAPQASAQPPPPKPATVRKQAQRARQAGPRCTCTACGHEHARKEEK